MLRVDRTAKSKLHWDKVKDNGKRSTFGTGSVRDTQEGKGRYDLIPANVLKRLAQHYENGALKYGDNNWQKGQPLYQYYNSALRHLMAIKDADLSEDHFAAAIWNIASMIHHIDAMLDSTLPESLDSFGIIAAIKNSEFDAYYNPPLITTTAITAHDTFVPITLSGVMNDSFLNDNRAREVKAFDKDRFDKSMKRSTHRS